MRILSSASVVTAAAAACLLLAPTSHAISPATKGGNGDNGTVKIHDSKTGEEFRKNEPKVCEFYLDAFGFDAVQEVTWKIYQHPPTGRELAEEGSITLDGDGHGRTDDMTLPDGHYKLEWNFEGENGRAKHKVFWTDCEGPDTPGETSGGSTGETTEGTTGGSEETTGGSTEGSTGETTEGTTGETTEGAAGGEETTGGTEGSTGEGSTGEATEGAAGGEEPGASTGDGGNLAETGSEAPVAALAAAAAALLGAGSYLVMRRRKAAQG
ncbi:LPXTG cell wall anchor domain-containing protein [Streptomyces radiopugnans]|uniref:LPXTG cell wall anchor domain-containing protein n=1 Tax=Streptomyces radiopugnans TaxID=403935 RepID=UPI003F193913